MNGAGDFVIAYHGYDGNSRGVQARRFSRDGTPQGGTFIVDTNTSGDQSSAAVGVGGDGSFVISWNDSAGVASDVAAQRFDAAGARLGGQFTVNATTAKNQFASAVAIQPDGGFVVAWQSELQDGSGYGVYAQRFAAYENGASVGNFVFIDANNNGVQDTGETGPDGVLVTLTNEWGATVGTTTTAGGGIYRFDGVRPSGTYRLQFTAPSGFKLVRMDAGASNLLDSDADPLTGFTDPFTLGSGGVDLTRDAGLVALASISGSVFSDVNANGVTDGAETPQAGWTVFLDANLNGRLDVGEQSTVTGATGTFTFQNLLPAGYRLGVVPIRGWEVLATSGTLTQNLIPGQNRSGVNIGVRPTADLRFPLPVGAEHSLPPLGGTWNIHRYDLLATSANGNSVLVGEAGDANDFGVFASRMDAAGNRVGNLFQVNTFTQGAQYDPSVAIDAAGNFIIVWQSAIQDGGKPAIMARRFDALGNPLGGEFQVNVSRGVIPKSPTVGVDSAGNPFIAWVEDDGAGTGIVARRFDHDGNPLGDVFPVNTVTAGDQTEPGVAVDAGGDAVVIWESPVTGSSNLEVHARRYLPSGAPVASTEFTVSDPKGNLQYNASVAINASGEFDIAWQGPSTSGSQIYVSRYNAAGARQGAEIIATTTAGAQFPWIGLADDGTFALVWQAADDSGIGVYTRVFNGSGLAAVPPARVNTITQDDQFDPYLSMRPDGRYNVVWHAQGLNSIVTRVQQFDTYSAASTIGGFVWDDVDFDGIYDPGEPAGTNVKVELFNPAGAIAATTVTDANGSFRFLNLKAGATYVVRPTLPSGRVPTVRDAGERDARLGRTRNARLDGLPRFERERPTRRQ